MWEFIAKTKAQDLPNITDIDLGILDPNFGSVEGIVLGVLNWVFILGCGLAVIGIVYSGILYITSGGDTTKAETAKKNLIWSIIGLIVLILATLIVSWIQNIIMTDAIF